MVWQNKIYTSDCQHQSKKKMMKEMHRLLDEADAVVHLMVRSLTSLGLTESLSLMVTNHHLLTKK